MTKKKKKPLKKITYESYNFGAKIVLDNEGKKRMAFNSQALWQTYLNNTCKVNDEVTFWVTNKRPKRSEAQNRYYHLYLSLIGLSSGHTTTELKTWVKGKFLSQGITEVFGDKVRIVKSSADLNVSEFMELLERIEEETKIPLPVTDPFLRPLTKNEYDTLKWNQKKLYSRLTANVKI